METGSLVPEKAAAPAAQAGVDMRAALAEFIAMLLFVFVCVGSATGVATAPTDPGGPAWVQQVALTFGLCITALAFTIGHISGAQINCAVTLGLVVQGALPKAQVRKTRCPGRHAAAGSALRRRHAVRSLSLPVR